jgi:hypothetical protein
MRTTLSVDEDLLETARAIAASRGISFRKVINEALRAGLPVLAATPHATPYRTKPHKMGLKPGFSLDRIQDLLARTEGEESR